MPEQLKEYAVSVGVGIPTANGVHTTYSPTFYLREDVQGIVDDAHAEKIVREWVEKVVPQGAKLDVAVAATTVGLANPQADALLTRVLASQTKCALVAAHPFGLPTDYLLVREHGVPNGSHAFECGIAPDGRVSS